MIIIFFTFEALVADVTGTFLIANNVGIRSSDYGRMSNFQPEWKYSQFVNCVLMGNFIMSGVPRLTFGV
jgi:hypothetical protein